MIDTSPLPVSVAPMEGITGFPTRLWLHWTSRPASMTTPFFRATRAAPERHLPLLYAPELHELRGVLPYTLTPQLMAAEPDNFLRAAALLPPAVAAAIELNCGCPSPNCAGKDAGSGILRDPDAFGRTLARLSAALGPQRLAVKMRLGIAAPEEFDVLLPLVADLPLARLTVHARTRLAGYRGQASWAAIQTAAARAAAPTWASGDVLGHATLDQLRAVAPTAAGAMIGRGVMRNPWIFAELRTGVPVRLDITTLANALLSFALVNELSISAPDKLVARVAKGRLEAHCGVDVAAWERVTTTLTSMAFGAPFLLSARGAVPTLAVSPTTMARLRLIWSHLRTGLPPEFFAPRLMRAKTLLDFFSGLFALARPLSTDDQVFAIGHRAEWDHLFSGARGASATDTERAL